MNIEQILASAVLVFVSLAGVLLWRRAEAEHRALVASTRTALQGLAAAVEELSRNIHEAPAHRPGLSAETSPPAPAGLPELTGDVDEQETTHVYARPTLISRSHLRTIPEDRS